MNETYLALVEAQVRQPRRPSENSRVIDMSATWDDLFSVWAHSGTLLLRSCV